MSSRRGPRAATQRLHPTGASVVSYAGAQKGPKGRFCAGACRLTLPQEPTQVLFSVSDMVSEVAFWVGARVQSRLNDTERLSYLRVFSQVLENG